MVERSKTKFNEIDALKKQLAEAERNLARYVEGQSMLKDDTSTMTDDDKQSIEIKLEQIEKMVKETRTEMKEFMSKSTIGSLTSTSEYIPSDEMMSSSDSRHMLDDNVIHSRMVLNEPDNDDLHALTKPLKKKICQVMEGFKQLEDSPQHYGAGSPETNR